MEVKLPFLGEGVQEAIISLWLVSEGDTVAKDQDLVEVSTSKAVFHVSAPVGGRIVAVVAQEGEVVQVGQVLAILQQE